MKGKVFEYKKEGNNVSDNEIPEVSDVINKLRFN